MRNLLDTDAFVVGMLVLVLGVCHLATDQSARDAFGELAKSVVAMEGEHDVNPSDNLETEEKRIDPTTVASSIATETMAVIPAETVKVSSVTASHTVRPDTVPASFRQRLGEPIRTVEPRRPMRRVSVSYPVANTTVESWNGFPAEMMPSDTSDAFNFAATDEPCGDPNCRDCVQAMNPPLHF